MSVYTRPPYGLVREVTVRYHSSLGKDARNSSLQAGVANRTADTHAPARLGDTFVALAPEFAKMYQFISPLVGCEQVNIGLQQVFSSGAFKFRGILDRSCLLASLRAIARGGTPGTAATQLSRFAKDSILESFQRQGFALGQYLAPAMWLGAVCGLPDLVTRGSVFFSEPGVAETSPPADLRLVAVACSVSRISEPLYQVCLEVELRAEEFPTGCLIDILKAAASLRYPHPAMARAACDVIKSRANPEGVGAAGGAQHTRHQLHRHPLLSLGGGRQKTDSPGRSTLSAFLMEPPPEGSWEDAGQALPEQEEGDEGGTKNVAVHPLLASVSEDCAGGARDVLEEADVVEVIRCLVLVHAEGEAQEVLSEVLMPRMPRAEGGAHISFRGSESSTVATLLWASACLCKEDLQRGNASGGRAESSTADPPAPREALEALLLEADMRGADAVAAIPEALLPPAVWGVLVAQSAGLGGGGGGGGNGSGAPFLRAVRRKALGGSGESQHLQACLSFMKRRFGGGAP